MDTAIIALLDDLRPGVIKVHANMAVAPLFWSHRDDAAAAAKERIWAEHYMPHGEHLEYVTLSEALEEGEIAVREMPGGGRVPEVEVEIKGERRVLLLDGEELEGAKQNRVVNTTLLLEGKSKTVVPVSCTEAGRWHSVSRQFRGSDVMMSPELRARKTRSVSRSLRHGMSYRSDQTEVWNGVREQTERAHAHTPTNAMRDVFEARRADLASYMAAFDVAEGQRGLLVFVNGRAVAFDVLSRAEAYAVLHRKLVRSYAMDALLAQDGERHECEQADAESFLVEAATCNGEGHDSVGLGRDHRCTSRRMAGSALVFRDTVIHAAFFRSDDDLRASGGRMASSRRRRSFRRR